MKNEQKAKNIRFIHTLDQIEGLPPEQKKDLAQTEQTYRFYANDYYLSLIHWNDRHDPIRRLIIPDPGELERWGDFDPSGEVTFTVMPGVEHKYPSTALLLVSNACGGICRYCFRKRVFISSQGEILKDLPAAAAYLRDHAEITNVLLTGGDPLALATGKLELILDALLPIEHIRIIRIGSKMPAFNPFRITEDPALAELIVRAQKCGKKIYIMTHFDHPRELTGEAMEAIACLRRAGADLANQTPIIAGINDDPAVLAELFRQLSFAGIAPYYIFQCRPASGNKHLAVPIETGYEIFEQACSQVSGLAKRARFVMSHITGKIEIVGLDAACVYMKYHRAAEEETSGRFFVCGRNPDAYWLDDYETFSTPHTPAKYPAYGPE